MADSNLNYDNLVGPDQTKEFRLALNTGAILSRGEAVGYITATDKVDTYDSGGAGGQEVFYGICAEAVDQTAGDVYVSVFVKGTFNENKIIFSASGDTMTQAIKNKARDLGIIIKKFASAT